MVSMTNEEFSERIVAMIQTLYRVSYSQLAQAADRDEAVQEALCKAWRKRGRLQDERFMQTWLIRILLNECHNIQRKRQRETLLNELPDRIVPADANYELHDALLRLDENLRLPVLLHYMEGFKVGEIAGILRLPEGTVKSRMRKGREELKKILDGEDESLCMIREATISQTLRQIW